MVCTHELTKRYARVAALVGCNLSVRRGEVFGLLGPNGAGKSTLLRLLMGFLRPTSGWAMIDEFKVNQNPVEVQRRTAYLPGDVRPFRRMRGKSFLKFMAAVRGAKFSQRTADLTRRLALDANCRVSKMSTGMRQKLALIATLAAETPLYVLDEPTSNLDPGARHEVLQLVREARHAGRTVLFSSHILPEVEQVCDRVAILRSGQLVCTHEVSQLRRRHRLQARLRGTVPPTPPEIATQISAIHCRADMLRVETSHDLAPLLSWLSTLPIDEVCIESVGLRAVYEAIHPVPTVKAAAPS